MQGNRSAEEKRLDEAGAGTVDWRCWGPYLSERQWGTVREDYSAYGSAWEYFPHDHARSRAYRWGEDGLAGISDRHQRLCFALALWNGQDPILKERLFGLTGNEGNHGEDVKEYYFYLDNTPTHAYMRYLYKYPQAAFPYGELVNENQQRDRHATEYELLDTGVFAEDRYFDVVVDYAKAAPEDILIRISVSNRGPAPATLHVLPTLWFRNTWSWQSDVEKPSITKAQDEESVQLLKASHPLYGNHWLYYRDAENVLFTENETNTARVFNYANASPYVKDGINDFVVNGERAAINPAGIGTKSAIHYPIILDPNEGATISLRLSVAEDLQDPLGPGFEKIIVQRKTEADVFYERLSPFAMSEDMKNVQRQALAGLLWSKQYYYFDMQEWLSGDPAGPPPPPERHGGRNRNWLHLNTAEVISMPDKWEYPWFAAWDLAFHTVPFALIDPDFAKKQLLLLTRVWYMHPNGQLPAYEWAFDDVNPPVHAWAAMRVYQIEHKMYGRKDRTFLERVFQKLLLNFTWWVNRKDADGKNVFEGGFLGLDNVGAFDRSTQLPTGGVLEQADGTSWMAMYSLNMLSIALELAKDNPAYEDIATKFFEHFIYIAHAINDMGEGSGLWDDEDGFYYDVLRLPDGGNICMRVQSIAGLIPLFAVVTLNPETLSQFPDFRRRLAWFVEQRYELVQAVIDAEELSRGGKALLSIVHPEKLRRILARMLSEEELLSPYGIRSVSKRHADHPFSFEVAGNHYSVDYQPGESNMFMFGGNSNWRGPIWFPLNFLLIESLQKFHYFLGEDFTVECPTGSGQTLNLWEVATELSRRQISVFLRADDEKRPVNGESAVFQHDPHWRDHILFYEYFHGDSGGGLGASHQTGWTGVVAKLIRQYGEYRLQGKTPAAGGGTTMEVGRVT